MPPPIDLTGTQVGSWKVTGRSGRPQWWDIQHNCGAERTVRGDTIREGSAPKCDQCRMPSVPSVRRRSIMPLRDPVWSDEKIRMLRELWTRGIATAEIGRELGMSKNAIIGKAHRLDLAARESPIRRPGPRMPAIPSVPRVQHTLPPLESDSHTDVAGTIPKPSSIPPRPATAVVLRPWIYTAPKPTFVAPPPPKPAPVYRGKASDCCWPIGEPRTKAFRFCDGVSVPGRPYCIEHIRIAYVRVRDRREEAA